jgi:hypothetical protein
MTTETESMARALQPELERAGWALSLGSIGAVLDALDFQVRASKKVGRTDAQRLDELEALVAKGDCPGIINDDNGHWAVSGTGMQSISAAPHPADVSTAFFVPAGAWHDSIRKAIDAYLDEGDDK